MTWLGGRSGGVGTGSTADAGALGSGVAVGTTRRPGLPSATKAAIC